ncbi:MAG: hypothetical protein A2270_00105 [Elusimicrobia bacterium RIFOXYA12_FULL_51_18]|nr:MAG: hypothetical protein A2270_00105 [Elusimicrobia bacterium RIFOXYA12_FULL_51_18]OGS32337.1 MAG: hypothetical protein A2218_02995 [Elusimicrobia bacterium RIFOXYA2_FULL_53_38]
MIKMMRTVFTQKTHDGTTERLLQLALAYFATYIATGIAPKYFMNTAPGYPAMNDVQYMVYSTLFSSLFCVSLVIAWKWYKFQSQGKITVLGMTFPKEFLYIIPSGVCTAVVIPTTTLMYLLPISVMVAMIIMRASIIVISRIIDTIQIYQGILTKKVYWEENVAVIFALFAVALQLLNFKGAITLARDTGNYMLFLPQLFVFDPNNFAFLTNAAAVTILTSYIIAYAIRIYIMNYFKNTRTKGVPYDNKGFFAVEQLSASGAMVLATLAVVFLMTPDPSNAKDFVANFQSAFSMPHPQWFKAAIAGIPYGIGAFFSVFLFMFKGRTATFSGLVNRLTSLIAGTITTLLVFLLMAQKPPKMEDWLGLIIILVAIYFLGLAEKKRACELATAHEIEPEKDSEITASCDTEQKRS